jgi:hypothetical protein
MEVWLTSCLSLILFLFRAFSPTIFGGSNLLMPTFRGQSSLFSRCSYLPVLSTSETSFFGTVDYRLNITLMHQ